MRRDRLAHTAVVLALLALAIAVGAAAYLIARGTGSTPEPRKAATHTPNKSAAPAVTTTTAPAGYAGLTSARAARLAASDWASFLKNSGASDSGTPETTKPTFARTRCFHSGHWAPYWRVQFAGTSAIFESRRLGLIFCNRDPNVIELGPSLEH